MRIIIAGDRNFHDYHFAANEITNIIEIYYSTWQNGQIEIISGGAKGVDTLAAKYASIYNIKFKPFPANWTKYGLLAGPIRNTKMAQYASQSNGTLIAFWNGLSKGTKNMIQAAKKYELRIHIIDVPKGE